MTQPAVLLVDDRAENLLALKAVLAPLDCRIVSVTSGDAALKALLQEQFAVVLLDVQMPGLDGFETAELIKRRERTRAVPIIFVTAISKERHHVFRGYSAGAVDYLFKPYDPELLVSKVRVFLELDAKSRAAARSEALLRAAFDHAPIGMARLDLEGRFAEVNRAFGALLGHEPAALRDRLLESLKHPDDQLDPERLRALHAGELEREEHEARLMSTAGEAIPCLLTYSLARAGAGLPPALVVQVQDLRARRRAEHEREQRVREQVARAAAERASESLRALQSISDAAISNVGLDQLMGDLLNRVADAFAVDTVAIVLEEAEGASVVHQIAGADGSGAGRRWYTVVTGDHRAGQHTGFETSPLGSRMAAAMTMPLVVDAGPIGSLHVGTLFERTFTGADRDLLRLAADRAALAIQRARLHQRDHAITEELQRSLLPAVLPEVGGLATAARYFPGGAGERVGGDWYDAVVQPDGRLLLIIGDVAGHGIGAATTMGQLRSALRAYALDGHAPGALLERLNAYQIGMHTRGMTTVALVLVDLAEGELTYASAGHLPPLLCEGEADVPRWLDDALGPPLGAVDDMAYPEGTATLTAGSTLVLYTDGLVELRGESVDLGLARLRESLEAAPEAIDALCDRILQRTLAQGTAEDDVTLLVLRTVPERRRSDRRRPPEEPARSNALQLAMGTWPHRSTRAARVELPRTTRAARQARRIVRETMADAISAEELDNVHLLVTEIVSNAVVHGSDEADDEDRIVVHLAAAPEALRVEVTNAGEPFELRRPTPVDVPGGFGLVIVDHLASRWGVDFEQGVCVWFEFDRVRADTSPAEPSSAGARMPTDGR